ncbi:hypothetical protein [Sphingomonas crocodyli]|uniref:Uncharacterized protein n=1 Tax=Sphingomonas crocodyli TaxID=1979270 RepID=A0A437LXR9_9SPHN|nr:hypothetical protein [Sphingomonas crocodyli]RVT90211.1 hypothetical protein EOD43_18105 [Sphingomonas crocodyli]
MTVKADAATISSGQICSMIAHAFKRLTREMRGRSKKGTRASPIKRDTCCTCQLVDGTNAVLFRPGVIICRFIFRQRFTHRAEERNCCGDDPVAASA